MELWAMEGLHISLPCNQTQPDVVEPEHLVRNLKKHLNRDLIKKIWTEISKTLKNYSYFCHLCVVGGEVHINKSLSRKHISTSCYIRGPEVIGVLVQTNKPL